MSNQQSAYYYGMVVAHSAIWNDERRKALREEILAAVHEDPLIGDKANITVNFPKDDEKGIRIEGKLKDDKAKERLKEIAQKRTPNDIKVYDEVTVDA